MQEITIIEDDEAFWSDWSLIAELLNLKLNVYSGFDELEHNFRKNEICKQIGIFVDYDLGSYNAFSANISQKLREDFQYKGPLVLISIFDQFANEHESTYKQFYDVRLDKKEVLKIDNIHIIRGILGVA